VQTANTFPHLASLANYHFKKAYNDPREANLAEIIRVAQIFPRYVEKEEGN